MYHSQDSYKTILLFFNFLHGVRALILFSLLSACFCYLFLPSLALKNKTKYFIDGGSKVVHLLTNFSDGDINTSQRLSLVLLNKFNFLSWSRAITIALGGRSKLGYINSSITSLEVDAPEYETWLSKDQLVMS